MRELSSRELSPQGTVPHQHGFVLIAVIVALVLVASITMLLSTEAAVEAERTGRSTEALEADYLAQAALQHAIWQNDGHACAGDFNVPSTVLGAHSYAASVTGGGTTTTYNVSVDQDAWIRSDDVTRNNGTTADQHIRFETGKVEQTLTRFDLSALPAGAQINSATAWFYVTPSGPGGGAHPEGPVTVHRVTADWTETGATWDTMNGNFETSILATIPAQPVAAVWVKINLTAQVQAWVNGQANYGILMGSDSEGVHGKYASREGSEQPYIEVVVGSALASPVSIQANGTLANGVTRILSRPAARALQPFNTVILQPGATDGTDAYIWKWNASTNYGADDETWVSLNGNSISRSLFTFALGAVPAGSKILSATLSLHHESGNNPDVPVTAHRITNPWNEDFVTWNRRDNGTNWTTAGGDFDAAVVSTTSVGPASNIRYEWDIASLVQGWTDGAYPNYGVALATTLNGAVGERFYTSDEIDPTRRPRLTITYACECGSACLAPQGTGSIVMVVINPTTLVPSDAYKKALFESWGYTVNVLSESANQTTYNGAVATNDVVFISESVNSSQVGDKLVGAPIGVVSQDGSYNGDLGIASGSASPVGSTINISDNSHYITLPFASGPVNIYSAAMEGLAVAGTPAPGLQTLADWSGAGGLVVLNQGDALGGGASGGTAAGRRVLLPIGGAGIDFAHINGNGRLIMQRALAWGMNADAVSGLSGKLLLVVGDATSLSNKDADRKSLIESWGYAVTLIDDGADQFKFDTEAAANDVVYVTAGVSGPTLLDKVTNTTTPVVSERGSKLGNFGFSSIESGTLTAAAFTGTDTLHYITQPFGGNPVTVFGSSLSMAVPSGTLAPDLQNVGEIDSFGTGVLPALATLEAGATRYDGNPSPGRRAHLPFGAADISQMTTDALTLMQRAIEWGAGAGAGCGSILSLLMIVDDAANPTSEELSRETLLGSWCYSVTLMTALEPEEAYEKYVLDSDVVYVAASVNYADVGNKLKFQPKGIVAEPSILSSRLGFTSGTSGYTGTVTELSDNTHYITSGFALGNLAVTTVSTSLRHFTNTMGPGFRTLSVRPTQTNPMIMTLDTGDELLWGGNAPDRRVMLPWGGSSTFDVNNLTADGQTILKRSLEWAAAEKSLEPIAHWKLDETSGTTAVDSVGGHDGNLPNGTDWMPGYLDGGLNFDGSSDYVNVPHDSTLSLTTFSITAWVQASSLSGWQIVLSKGSPSGSNYYLGTSGSEISVGFQDGGTWAEFPTSGAGLTTGQWYHLAGTFDNSTGAASIYLDGALIHSDTTALRPVANTNAVTIGTSPANEYWPGLLDDVRLYDRVLDASEVAALAAEAGTGGGGGGGGGSTEYLDNFSSVAFTGSEGSTDWSGDPWEELSESDGPASGKLFIASDPDVSDSGSQRLVVDSRFTEVKRAVDLSGFPSAWLSFTYRRDGYPTPSDYFAVLVSDNGSTWTELDRIYGIANDPVYRPAVYDISKFASANTEIRIATGGINNMQTLYVDNMRVASTPLGGCAGIFADKFDSRSYTNNDGTLIWASDWTEIKENNGPTSGDIQIRAEINNYQLRVRDDGYGLWREADLSGTSQATLSLDYKRLKLDSSSDYVTVDVSSDGGSNWTELDRFEGGGDDSLYQNRYYDITAYAGANTQIRLLGSASLGGQDEVWFDNIEIVCTP